MWKSATPEKVCWTQWECTGISENRISSLEILTDRLEIQMLLGKLTSPQARAQSPELAADVRIYSWKCEFFSTVLHSAENIISGFPQHYRVSVTVRNKESGDQLFLQLSISPNESGLHFFSNRHTDFTGHSNLFVPNLRLSLLKINPWPYDNMAKWGSSIP